MYIMIGQNSSNEVVTYTSAVPDFEGNDAPETLTNISLLNVTKEDSAPTVVASGYSVLGKATAGSGTATSITSGTNAIMCRRAGGLEFLTGAASQVLGINPAGGLNFSKVNYYHFATQAANTITANPSVSASIPEAVAVSTNSVLGRGSGNIANITINEGNVLGRNVGGSLGSVSIGTFPNISPGVGALKKTILPQDVAALTVADAGNESRFVDVRADYGETWGYYIFEVIVIAKMASGSLLRRRARVDAHLNEFSGFLSLLGTPVYDADGASPISANMAIVLTASGDDLRVRINNTTGESISCSVMTQWTYFNDAGI